MAPEQFSSIPLHPTPAATFDVFALGVIAFEVFTDGKHPIGITTADVWPWRQGIPQRWNRESTWREWANDSDKWRHIESTPLPSGTEDLILTSLSPDVAARPSLEDFEDRLWSALRRLDSDSHDGFQMQVSHLEGLSSGNVKWPHMEERLMQLRQLYGAG
jgi:serine/threonine protein kinase